MNFDDDRTERWSWVCITIIVVAFLGFMAFAIWVDPQHGRMSLCVSHKVAGGCSGR